MTEDVGSWLKVTATYNDGQGGADKSAQKASELAVRALPSESNTGPDFGAETADRSIVEGSTAGRPIGDAVTATDSNTADEGSLTYTLGGDDGESFDIVASSGQLLTKAPLVYSQKRSYEVRVTATDPSLESDTITVTINVTRVPQRPSNSGNSGNSGGNSGGGGGSPSQRTNSKPGFDEGHSTTREVAENTPAGRNIGQPVTATDADNDTLTYSLSGTHAASFGINSSTGQLKTKDALDHEARASYLVTVTASDGMAGSTDATIALTITVTDVNEPPAFDGQTATREVAENTVAGQNIGVPVAATDQDTGDTLTYTLGGTDASAFDIDASTGQLKTKAPLDYETTTSYTITVSVRDSKDAEGTADTATDNSITVTVNVSDLAEDGTITLSSRQPQVGTAFTATLTDPNIASPVATWAWEKSDDKTTWTTISAATTYTYTPLTADVGSYLQVTATYDDGQGVSKSAQAVSDFVVREEPASNEGPSFSRGTETREVSEDAVVGADVGDPVTATDPNADDEGKLTYTLGGTDVNSFTIDAALAQIKTATTLDYDTENSYTVTVTAKDPFLASATIAVTINVTRVRPAAAATIANRRSSGDRGGGAARPPSRRSLSRSLMLMDL